ncbi:MAG: DNA-3-methyladenine glycosylase 2 family protein [Bacilli bacterium]|nr:DNA-3-methyladenine glycosylase 2 family protein [Bacilli bacterium]
MKLSYDLEDPKIKYLLTHDETLKPIFESVGKIEIKLETDHYEALASAIVSQQLSGKVAQVIYQRVIDFFSGDLTPVKILAADKYDLRNLGLSWRKVEYLQSLAKEVDSGDVILEDLKTMTDEAVIEMLTRIKGIGRWSAEMFLMFSLGREDVFSPLDLGLRKGLEKLYQRPFSVEEARLVSDKWTPYRSVVAFYLWRYN